MLETSLQANAPAETGKRDLGSARRKAMLILLAIIYGLNFLDRQIIVILQEPI